MRVAIVGSRHYARPNWVASWIARLSLHYPDCVIVSGGAPGVDTWAIEAAVRAKLAYEVFEADWDTYGKSAGPKRNQALVSSLGPGDKLVAFWDGQSRGTAHVVSLAEAAGIQVTVYGPVAPMFKLS